MDWRWILMRKLFTILEFMCGILMREISGKESKFWIQPLFSVLLVIIIIILIIIIIIIIIAFVKERFHNAVEIDILGIFEGYSSLQIWPPQKKFLRGEIIQDEWRNFHQARALYLTEVLTCVLVCFLVEFDLLVAFGVLSCRILDCASLFIYVHEHDRLCFPMLT